MKIEEEKRSHIEWVPGKKKDGYFNQDKTELRIFKPGEKIETETRGENINFNMGKLVRAMAGADTTGEAVKYVRDLNSTTGSVVIPKKFFAQIIDNAREMSAVWGKVPMTLMDNNNLTVARISKDAVATFVAEGELIPASSTEFTGVNLEGKTLAMFIPITEQLLSSSNINDVIMSACAKAIAVKADNAMLYGTGLGAEIKGIVAHDNINKIDHTGPCTLR